MNSISNLLTALMQAGPATEDRRFLFADEKINTVIVVLMVVLVGIGAYLILTGRKVRKMEKELAEMGSQSTPSGSGIHDVEAIEVKKR